MNDELLRQELKRHSYNVSKTARVLGIDYFDLVKRLHPSNESMRQLTIPKGGYPEDITTLGKPGMESYVIAVKKITYNWPVQFMNAIHNARRKYDDGTHEMCQETRSDGWIVLYLIPRKHPDKNRQPYFFRRGV